MEIDKNFFMIQALKEAWKYQGLTYPKPAVGYCIVGESNELLAINAHKKASTPHAEVMALKDAYLKLTNDKKITKLTQSSDIHKYLLDNHNNCFEGVSLYTTLEPCSHIGKTPSCASLISNLNIKKVYVGFNDINKEASNGNKILKKANIELEENVLQKECSDLIAPFNLWQKNKFVFFKWAQRLNATTDDGVISSKHSRINVHAMRDVCDLLVIGGNTVRIDRPTLDARLVDGKAPDVLIISREEEFDKTIPLFNIENRKVFISDNLSIMDNYKNIMIEGSSKMYELTQDKVDYYLCYLAPKFGGANGFENTNANFDILNIQKEEKDIIMWMKKEL